MLIHFKYYKYSEAERRGNKAFIDAHIQPLRVLECLRKMCLAGAAPDGDKTRRDDIPRLTTKGSSAANH